MCLHHSYTGGGVSVTSLLSNTAPVSQTVVGQLYNGIYRHLPIAISVLSAIIVFAMHSASVIFGVVRVEV